MEAASQFETALRAKSADALNGVHIGNGRSGNGRAAAHDSELNEITMEQMQQLQRGQQTVNRILNPIYQLLFNLHSEVGEFVKSHIKPYRPLGLLSPGNEPSNAEDLI